MIKLLKTFLSTSILITSFTVTGTTIIYNLTSHQLFLAPSRALYQNIDASFVNYNADVKKELAGANGSHTGSTGKIFSWRQYASSWEEFKANYGGLNLVVNMNIAFNWYNIKWQNTNLYIPLNNITVNSTNWVKITQVDQTTTQGGRWDSTHALLKYDCWVNNNDVLIRFGLETWASNNYDNYYYNIDTRKITCNTTFDYNTIKEKFNRNVNNKRLNLQSDFSSSLLDKRNKVTSKKNLIS